MVNSHLNKNILAHTAISALKKAYDDCSDMAAKESILTAFKALIQLSQDLGKYDTHDNTFECDSDFDPSEYCAAV